MTNGHINKYVFATFAASLYQDLRFLISMHNSTTLPAHFAINETFKKEMWQTSVLEHLTEQKDFITR